MNAKGKARVIAMNVADLIKNRREELGLSPRKLGEKAKVSYTVIYDLEKRYVIPRIETLVKLAEALDMEVEGISFNVLSRKEEDINDSFSIIQHELVLLGFDRTKMEDIKDYMNFKLLERGIKHD